MGKSHHAARIAREATGRVVVVACRGLPDSPYAALGELLSALDLPPAARGDEPYLLGLRLLDALAHVTVVLDDLDHADDHSLAVLRHAATRLPTGAVLAATHTTGRPPPLGTGLSSANDVHVRRIDLIPLSLAEVTAVTGPERAAGIYTASGGIPRHAHELARTGGALPAVIAETAAERLRAVAPLARTAVEALALLGRPAGLALLTEICARPAGAVATAVDEASRAGLCTIRGETAACEPPVVADAVVHALPLATRRATHAAILAALVRRDDEAPLDDLVRHGRGAGDLVTVARHAMDAVLRIPRDGEPDPADTAHLARLLRDLLRDTDLPFRVRAGVGGRLNHLVVTRLECRQTMLLLREVLGDRHVPAGIRGELRLGLGLLMMNQDGDSDGGRAELTRAVGELHRRPALAARAMTALALPYWGSAPAEEHARWLARAENALPDRAEAGLRAAVTVNRVTALLQFGDPRGRREAEATPVHADDPGARRELLRGHSNFAAATLILGHDAAAETHLGRAATLAEQISAVYTAPILACTRLRLDLAGGHWDGLARRAEEHLAAYAGNPYVSCTGNLVLGSLALARGDHDEAARRLADPVLRPGPHRMEAEAAVAIAARIRLSLRTGAPASARELLDGLDRVRAKGLWTWSADLVDAGVAAFVHAGDTTGARLLTTEFSEALADRDYPHGHAVAAACAALLDDDPALHLEAAARYAAMPRPYAQALALENAARGHLGHGNAPAALPLLAQAFALLDALGATYDAARCARLLRDNGEAPGHRRGRPGYGGHLSPREREVAHLLAAGRTNREIAEVLFLSVRTVEHHVASVMRKLGASGRDEVVVPADGH
ncbi:helix-turn-helix transcriptional regulator [Phytomonospora endophytica]|nr:helix-turn-helix transcriptional regulator [Phytomonospora endophytica]